MKFRERRSGPTPVFRPIPLEEIDQTSSEHPPEREHKSRTGILVLLMLIVALGGAASWYYIHYGFELAPWIPWQPGEENGSNGGEIVRPRPQETPSIPIASPTEGSPFSPENILPEGPRLPLGVLAAARRERSVPFGRDGDNTRPQRGNAWIVVEFFLDSESIPPETFYMYRYMDWMEQAFEPVRYRTDLVPGFLEISGSTGPEDTIRNSRQVWLLYEIPLVSLGEGARMAYEEMRVPVAIQ